MIYAITAVCKSRSVVSILLHAAWRERKAVDWERLILNREEGRKTESLIPKAIGGTFEPEGRKEGVCIFYSPNSSLTSRQLSNLYQDPVKKREQVIN